jgi:hypothetical protein
MHRAGHLPSASACRPPTLDCGCRVDAALSDEVARSGPHRDPAPLARAAAAGASRFWNMCESQQHPCQHLRGSLHIKRLQRARDAVELRAPVFGAISSASNDVPPGSGAFAFANPRFMSPAGNVYRFRVLTRMILLSFSCRNPATSAARIVYIVESKCAPAVLCIAGTPPAARGKQDQ